MKKEVFFEHGGRRSRGKVYNCKYCEKDFIGKEYKDKRKYCSTKCSQKGSKVRIKVSCAHCSNIVYKTNKAIKNSKSGLYFCNRKCKTTAQRLGGIKEIMPSHYGTRQSFDYRGLFTDEELVCYRCGYDEFRPSIHIHHLDRDRTNNSKDNLIPLCANCHYGLHRNCWDIKDIV